MQLLNWRLKKQGDKKKITFWKKLKQLGLTTSKNPVAMWNGEGVGAASKKPRKEVFPWWYRTTILFDQQCPDKQISQNLLFQTNLSLYEKKTTGCLHLKPKLISNYLVREEKLSQTNRNKILKTWHKNHTELT